jgi:hypothetical integral membrane protein (TIGR02206 family)
VEWFDVLFTRDTPKWALFTTFGTPHLIWLALSLLASIWFFQKMKRMAAIDPERVWNITKWLGLWCFVGWVVPAFLLVAVDQDTYAKDNLPLHLCSSGGIILPLTVLTRNKVLLNFAYGLYLPGAVAAIATPATPYEHYSYLSLYFILFVLSHLIIIFVPLGAIAAGELQPSWRYYPAVLGIGFGLMAIDYPLNKLLDSNYLFVNYPAENTPLELFAEWVGVPGYVGVLAVLGAIVIAGMFASYQAVSHLRRVHPVAQVLVV